MQRTQVDGSAPSAMRSGRVYYLNGQNNDLGYEKEVTDSGLTEHKHYLSAGGIVFAMQITRSGNLTVGGSTKPAQTLQYLHHDHLGSVAVVTDETGSVTERLAYDPWGKRRFPNGTADQHDSIVGLTLDRGFTMHEHLDEMGLIHMNGRIYDPLIGRFMSADPFIQAPENLQSHNRFAYVMNNPLNLVDPSGYKSLWMKIRGTVIRAIAAVADAMGCGGYCSAAVGAYQGYKSGGGIGAIIGGITGYLGYQYGGQTIEAYAVRVIGSCASAAAAGGSCGRGAIAGAINHYGGDQGFWGAVTAGCVSSMVNGGKCGDGAVDAAISIAATHVVQGAVDIYKEAQRMAAAENFRRNLVACAPCVGVLVYTPEIVGAGKMLWNATRAYFALKGIANVLTANQAANPGETNGTDAAQQPKADTDGAVNGLIDGLSNETDAKGRPVKGHYVKPGGNAQQDLDSLPGTQGKNGQRILPDGSIAGVHDSTSTGVDTLHIHRPSGSRDLKIRYPK